MKSNSLYVRYSYVQQNKFSNQILANHLECKQSLRGKGTKRNLRHGRSQARGSNLYTIIDLKFHASKFVTFVSNNLQPNLHYCSMIPLWIDTEYGRISAHTIRAPKFDHQTLKLLSPWIVSLYITYIDCCTIQIYTNIWLLYWVQMSQDLWDYWTMGGSSTTPVSSEPSISILI